MDFLRLLVFLFFIFFEIYCLLKLINYPPHLAPLTVILSNTLLLYFFALAGILQIGFYVTLLLGLASILISCIKRKKLKIELINLTPISLFMFILFLAFFYTRGTLFYSWDEFSHWGVIFKYLMTTQELPKTFDAVIVAYPPISPLWQFFVSKIIGFKEENAYFAHMLIQFSAIIALFPAGKRKNLLHYLLVLIVTTLSVIALNYRFQSLYVDLLMGLLLAVGFAQSRIDRSFTHKNLITLLLVMTSLVLIKPTGILLALLIAATSIICFLIEMKKNELTLNFLKDTIRRLLDYRILLILFVPLFAWLSWNLSTKSLSNHKTSFVLNQTDIPSSEIFPWYPKDYLNNLVIEETQIRLDTLLYMKPSETTIGIVDVLRSFTISAPYRTKIIAENFIKKISSRGEFQINISIKGLLIAILGLIIINLLILFRKDQTRNNKFKIFNLLLAIGFLIYTVSLYLSYIFIFYPAEGLTVPNLERYLGVYLLAWWLVNLVEFFVSEETLWSKRITLTILCGLFSALLLAIPTYRIIHLPYPPDPDRFVVAKTYKIISQVGINSTDKIYEVYSDKRNSSGNFESGYRHYIMRYLLTPAGSNIFGWSLGEDDPLSADLTPTEWLELLNSQGYTYVLVSNSDAAFWEEYHQLFNSYSLDFTKPQLFKVLDTGLEQIKLSY